MAGLLKDRFNHDSLRKLALEIQTVYGAFPAEKFLNSTMDKTWDSLEFKQRVMRISANLGKYLPADYKTAIGIIDKVILNYDVCLDGFVAFFPGFVELYGQDKENWDISKTHPELVMTIARDWYGKNINADWIIKRGRRTLLKKGNREVLDLFGLADAKSVKVDSCRWKHTKALSRPAFCCAYSKRSRARHAGF